MSEKAFLFCIRRLAIAAALMSSRHFFLTIGINDVLRSTLRAQGMAGKRLMYRNIFVG